nr:MAG TPA: hypothetical protein [Caudoviricetes sp.]
MGVLVYPFTSPPPSLVSCEVLTGELTRYIFGLSTRRLRAPY